MINKLNLATHPFRNRSLPYILTIFLLAISVAGALICFSTLRYNVIEDEEARLRIERDEAEIKRLKGEGAKVQQQLTPDQQSLMIAAHKLVANKDFGWSRLFADLESVMPGSVSASRISVRNVYNDGGLVKAELDLGVLARDYSSVMSMIDAMNNSGRFQAELRGQDRQKNERLVYSEFTLNVIYTPSYQISTTQLNDVAQNDQGGAQ